MTKNTPEATGAEDQDAAITPDVSPEATAEEERTVPAAQSIAEESATSVESDGHAE